MPHIVRLLVTQNINDKVLAKTHGYTFFTSCKFTQIYQRICQNFVAESIQYVYVEQKLVFVCLFL